MPDFAPPEDKKLRWARPTLSQEIHLHVPKDQQPEGTSGSEGSTSRSLLARLRANEAEAWSRLVILYTPLVHHWCRRWQMKEQDVADVIQEVFQAVASHVQQFRKDRPSDTFRGWLRTITRSKVMDYYRRQAHQPKATGGSVSQQCFAQIPDVPEEDCPEEKQAEGSLFLRALELLQSELHPRTWQAFWRVVVDGQSPADVGEELGMTPGAVRVAKCRVLHRLRQELGDLPE